MKVSDTEGHVCMGHNGLKAGDKVSLFKNVCTTGKGSPRVDPGVAGGCQKVKIGDGEITRVLNDHYSVMQVASGVSFAEGTVVERN